MRFSDIVGQESVKQRLRQMVDADRIPHALLLEGPEGVGKLGLARAFAQYVHCEHRTADGEPCGECPSCRQYETGNQADTFFVFPIFKRKSGSPSYCDEFMDEWNEFTKANRYASFADWIDTLNCGTTKPIIYNNEGDVILRKLSTKAYASSTKIMILWLPEKMNEQCANHLLKMIEEPHEGTILVFVSNDSAEILPTIYSRVQRIKVKPLTTETVARYMVDRYAVDGGYALSIANSSGGSITRAEQMLRNDDDARQRLEMFKRLMRSAYKKDVRDLKDWADEVAEFGREKGRIFMDYLSKMVRENFIYNIGNPALNYMSTEESDFSRKFSPFINERNIEIMVKEIDKAVEDIMRNANIKIVMFDFALKMTIAIKM